MHPYKKDACITLHQEHTKKIKCAPEFSVRVLIVITHTYNIHTYVYTYIYIYILYNIHVLCLCVVTDVVHTYINS